MSTQDLPIYTIAVIDDDTELRDIAGRALSAFNDRADEEFRLSLIWIDSERGVESLINEVKKRESAGERAAAVVVDRCFVDSTGIRDDWGEESLRAIQKLLPKQSDIPGDKHRNLMTVIYCSDTFDLENMGRITQIEKLADATLIKNSPSKSERQRMPKDVLYKMLEGDAQQIFDFIVRCLKNKLALERDAAERGANEMKMEQKQLVVGWLKPMQDYYRQRTQGGELLMIDMQDGSRIKVEDLLNSDHYIERLWFQILRKSLKIGPVSSS